MQYKELTNSLEALTWRKNGQAFRLAFGGSFTIKFFFLFFKERRRERKRYNSNQPLSKGGRSSRECDRGRPNQERSRNNDRTTPQCSLFCKKNNYHSNQCWSKQCTKSRNSDHKVKLSNEGEEWSLFLENMEGTS